MSALHDIVKKGSTDRSVTVRIIDSTLGTPETTVVFNTTGIDMWYRREGAAHSSITEATQTEAGGHTDGGFVHISDGVYRLDLPDAAFATGANYVDFGGAVTDMIVIGGRVRLVDVDLEDANAMGIANISTMVAGIIEGTCSGTPTTTSTNSNLSGYTADQLIGRTITFVTGTADGQQSIITDYVVTNGVITYATLNGVAPASTDTFKIT